MIVIHSFYLNFTNIANIEVAIAILQIFLLIWLDFERMVIVVFQIVIAEETLSIDQRLSVGRCFVPSFAVEILAVERCTFLKIGNYYPENLADTKIR